MSQIVAAALAITLAPSSARGEEALQTTTRQSIPGPSQYSVEFCVTLAVGRTDCTLQDLPLRYSESPLTDPLSCDATWEQQGSVSWADITLPAGKALYVRVRTAVPGQTANNGGFFVRPSRLTAQWGAPDIDAATGTVASFFLADTGQFSVEFAAESTWRDKAMSLSFPALMLFVNPPLALTPSASSIVYLTRDDVTTTPFDLGPGKTYVFQADENYDWGKAQVFKVHDNTDVFFEPNATVRARIIQTDKKVNNVRILGYGVLENHYEPEEYDVQGTSDDGSVQGITLYGKNLLVEGVTLINTHRKCHAFGYCLNFNANWSPLADAANPFEAGELQGKDMPYKFHRAHCQERHMDDTLNVDFDNCPTGRADGNVARNVKCITWQMGQDGLNAGKWGTVEDSFVRSIDDALKPWDSNGVYRNIVVWQLALGWPINFGWWSWTQPDTGTLVEDVYLIHNHNWVSSDRWPTTRSGQCVVGGVYGSGAFKSNYTLRNIFVETASGCAVGLEITNTAFSRHLTGANCTGNIENVEIDGMYFDEPFFTYQGGYTNFVSGESDPNDGCDGNLAGRVSGLTIGASVAGRSLTLSDFVVDGGSVRDLVFKDPPADPHPRPVYALHAGKTATSAGGGNKGAVADVDATAAGVIVASADQCVARCHRDLGCDCVVFRRADKTCWKRRGCVPSEFEADAATDVYLRPWPTVRR